jgi:hypothetical protein
MVRGGKMNMKSVGELIPKVTEKASSNGFKESQRSIPAEEFNEITKLFALLAVEYPFFLPKVDTDLIAKTNMWAKLLRPYDDSRRKDALKRCLEHYDNKGGPTVGEFLGLLKRNAAHEDFVRLPPPPATESVGRAALDAMKAIMRGNGVIR